MNDCEGLLEVGMCLETRFVDRIEKEVAGFVASSPSGKFGVTLAQRKLPGVGPRKLVQRDEERSEPC